MSKQRNQKPATQQRPSHPLRVSLPWLTVAVFSMLLVTSAFAYSAHLENNDQFCATCHTEPETTFVARTEHPAMDLASAHAAEHVSCIECHSGTGMGGRLNAMRLGARDLIAYLNGRYPQPATTTHPIADGNCLKCHQDVLQGRSFENHFHLLLPRWQALTGDTAASCVSCHTAHLTNGQKRIAWLNKEHTIARCNDCHLVMGD